MTKAGRVVSTTLPSALYSQLDEVAQRKRGDKSRIIREAVSQWLAEEQLRHEMTLEALQDVDEGRTISHEEMVAWAELRRAERQRNRKTDNVRACQVSERK